MNQIPHPVKSGLDRGETLLRVIKTIFTHCYARAFGTLQRATFWTPVRANRSRSVPYRGIYILY